MFSRLGKLIKGFISLFISNGCGYFLPSGDWLTPALQVTLAFFGKMVEPVGLKIA